MESFEMSLFVQSIHSSFSFHSFVHWLSIGEKILQKPNPRQETQYLHILEMSSLSISSSQSVHIPFNRIHKQGTIVHGRWNKRLVSMYSQFMLKIMHIIPYCLPSASSIPHPVCIYTIRTWDSITNVHKWFWIQMPSHIHAHYTAIPGCSSRLVERFRFH